MILSVLDSELLHNVHRNFRCFLVTAEGVILDKIWNYKLLEGGGGGRKEEKVRVKRLANVLSRHSLNESNFVTSGC